MKTAFVALLVFALAACSPAQPGETGNNPATPVANVTTTPAIATSGTAPAADSAMVLTHYHWQLADAVGNSGLRIDALFARAGKPLQLDFDAHDVSIGNTCNPMHGSYSVAGGKLTVGNLASTMMACSSPH